MVHPALRAAVLCAAAAAGGCALTGQERPISISSDPAGARVLVDGRDSGFVTPCLLRLDTGQGRQVELAREGYHTETRLLTPKGQVYAILWREMYVSPRAWRFPLFLNLSDFVVPVKRLDTHAPARIHVNLEREADAGAEAPGARAAAR